MIVGCQEGRAKALQPRLERCWQSQPVTCDTCQKGVLAKGNTMLSRKISIALLLPLALSAGVWGCAESSDTDVQDEDIAESQAALAYWSEATLWSNSPTVCFQNNYGACQNRCSGNHDKCASNTDCPSGQTCGATKTCFNGTTTCTSDTQCKTPVGACQKRCSVSHATCATNANCSLGEVCGTTKTCADGATTCTTDSQCTASSYSDAKSLVQSALNEAWGTPSSLVFNFTGDCPASPASSTMVLNLKSTGWGGSCGLGAGADCEFGILNRGRIQDVAVHEVGHALGLIHEHKRTDGSICTAIATEVAACQACAGGTCNATDFNNCIHPSPSRIAGTQTLTADEKAVRDNVLWQSGPDSAGRVKALTPYDGASIMNYCSDEYRIMDDNNPDVTEWRPTEYDRLGIEILYPKSTSIPVRCNRCFYGGSSLIVRTDGTMMDDWSGRDAFSWWDSGTLPSWRNTTTNTALPSGATLAASLVGNSAVVSFSATNRWNRKVITGSRTVEANDAQWTAVALTAL